MLVSFAVEGAMNANATYVSLWFSLSEKINVKVLNLVLRRFMDYDKKVINHLVVKMNRFRSRLYD